MINLVLKSQYDRAIHQTKNLIMNDVNKYLEKQESQPTFEQYMKDRKVFIEQIWLNTWLNTATSHIRYAEKKDYLTNIGLDVSNLNKKDINRLFRNEIREVEVFPYEEWLRTKLGENKEIWKESYEEKREVFLLKVEEQKELEKSVNIQLNSLIISSN